MNRNRLIKALDAYDAAIAKATFNGTDLSASACPGGICMYDPEVNERRFSLKKILLHPETGIMALDPQDPSEAPAIIEWAEILEDIADRVRSYASSK